VVVKRGLRLFVGQGKRNPELQAVKPRRLPSLLRGGALGMNDAAPGRHPVEVARANRLERAEAVTVDNLAVEQVRHGGQADVRVRRDVEPSTRREGAVHLVEEGEGADHPARCGRKDAPDRDAAEVAGAAVDHVRDHGQRAARTERFGRRLDAHRGIPAAILGGGRPVVDLSPSHST